MTGNKYLEKIAQVIEAEKQAGLMDMAKGLASKAVGAGKVFAKGVKSEGAKLGADIKNLKGAAATGMPNGAKSKSSVVGNILKNKITIAGGGAVAGGLAAKAMGKKKDD